MKPSQDASTFYELEFAMLRSDSARGSDECQMGYEFWNYNRIFFDILKGYTAHNMILQILWVRFKHEVYNGIHSDLSTTRMSSLNLQYTKIPEESNTPGLSCSRWWCPRSFTQLLTEMLPQVPLGMTEATAAPWSVSLYSVHFFELERIDDSIVRQPIQQQSVQPFVWRASCTQSSCGIDGRSIWSLSAWSNEGCLAVCYGTWSFVWRGFSGERPWGDFATCAMAWLQSITGREMGNDLTTHILSYHDVIQFWTEYLGPITQKCVCVCHTSLNCKYIYPICICIFLVISIISHWSYESIYQYINGMDICFITIHFMCTPFFVISIAHTQRYVHSVGFK